MFLLFLRCSYYTGAIAQLGERLLCTQEVGGSIPPGSTIELLIKDKEYLALCFLNDFVSLV